MNKLDKKHNSGSPDNWDEFRPETLLFATEVCMMDRDTKVIGAGDNGRYGGLAGAISGAAIVVLLLGLFQLMDQLQAPPQGTFKDYAPWKSARIQPVTRVAIGPPTPPPKPAVTAAPPAPPAPKPAVSEPQKPAPDEAAKAEAEAKAKAAEEAAKAEAEAKAKAAEEAEAKAKAAEEAARAEAEAKAKAAEEAAKAEAEAKAAEEAARAEAEAKAKAAEEAARAEAEAKARAAEEAAAAAAQREADILDAVKRWASAWSAQDIDAYISSYTADFKPPRYKSREYWEAQRRKRLSKPSSISIQLSNLRVHPNEDGSATVTFVQIYKSPTFSDSVRKTLVLKEQSGHWRISSETSEKL